MITRYNGNGQIDQFGEFVKIDDMQELVDFLYHVMRSKADVAIDLLAEKGENYLEQWGVL